ncbi:MAG TPA: DUF711 family protein, partial [Chitinophagaceae bacterium]
MSLRKIMCALFAIAIFAPSAKSQGPAPRFRIRTITAGVTLKSLDDTTTIISAIEFLKLAKKKFTNAGYEVQTIRVATSNLYSYLHNISLNEAIPYLKAFDRIASSNGIALFSIGQVLSPDQVDDSIGEWADALFKSTKVISFNLS